jgi:epsilon-lactone hydrolase
MRLRFCVLTLSVATLAACSDARVAQQPVPPVPQVDSSSIDAQGTAHITRVIPLPKTISSQAAEYIARPIPDSAPNQTLAERRARTDAMQLHDSEQNRALYPVNTACSG